MSFIKSEKFEGSALECIRYANGFEFEELSELTSIDKKRLIHFELDMKYPTDEEIEKLAKATNVKPSFFYHAWIKPPDYAFNFRN